MRKVTIKRINKDLKNILFTQVAYKLDWIKPV